jgi:hypothetical protein
MDRVINAQFKAITTLGHGTPLWWLAGLGYTNDFEQAEAAMGANGFAHWESYVAGLNPSDPTSQLRVSYAPGPTEGTWQVNWDPVPGRAYTILQSSTVEGGFVPVPGGASLPATESSLSLPLDPGAPSLFLKVGVELAP